MEIEHIMCKKPNYKVCDYLHVSGTGSFAQNLGVIRDRNPDLL